MIPRHLRIFGTVLIGAYAAIPLALALATYQGWLFHSSARSTSIPALGLVALIAATLLAEHAGAFPRATAGGHVLKWLAYWIAAFVWMVIVVRRAPENRAGAVMLIGPCSALMLAGVFYLARFAGTCTRYLTTATMTAVPVPMAPPPAGAAGPQEVPGQPGASTQSAQVDIAANTTGIALRLLGGIAWLLIFAQFLRGTSHDEFVPAMFYAGAVLLGIMALRSLPKRAPALSFAADGISIRRDLSTVRHLPWHEVIGFEMKSQMAHTFLVIHLRDANAFIARRGPISRFFMSYSQATIGSPLRIPVFWLKCDPRWLLQKANEMLMASRNPISGRTVR
jgi:hypothetical protein